MFMDPTRVDEDDLRVESYFHGSDSDDDDSYDPEPHPVGGVKE
jgi:hypothetical protein